jgi:phosphoglycolate phosphatase-like HAD superfamily hydrolase
MINSDLVYLPAYPVWIFDCDGVLLDSNRIKSEAFFLLALPYGEKLAHEFVAYAQATSGISRFVKIRYFHEKIRGVVVDESVIEHDLVEFGRVVYPQLLLCDSILGIENFLASLPDGAVAYVASGGLEEEVQTVLSMRGLAKYFKGIYGSPTPKEEIIRNILLEVNLNPYDIVMFGDSRLDHDVATANGLHFMFVAGASESPEGRELYKSSGVTVIENFETLKILNT